MAISPDTGTDARCPRCDSPAPNLHPAAQHEGETQLCTHAFHGPPDPLAVLDRTEITAALGCGVARRWIMTSAVRKGQTWQWMGCSCLATRVSESGDWADIRVTDPILGTWAKRQKLPLPDDAVFITSRRGAHL